MNAMASDLATASLTDRIPGIWTTPDRLAVRAMGRALAPKTDKRLRGCGWPIQHDGGPGLILVENGQIRGGQRKTCGSLTRCGYCTPYRWAMNETKAMVLTGRHLDAGGWIGTTTLTLPHRSHDPLRPLFDVLYGAWGARFGWRGWERERERIGLVADLSVLHVNYGPENGWHPHLHVAWFCVGDQDCWECFEGELTAAWRERVGSTMKRRTSAKHAVAGTIVKNPQGFLVYIRPDAPCMHGEEPPDWWNDEHGDSVNEWGDMNLADDDGWGSPGGDPWETEIVPDLVPSIVPDWDASASHEILSGIGRGAVAGDARSQAVFAEYIRATRGVRRVAGTWRSMNRAYGPFELPPTPRRDETLRRLWVHPSVINRLESTRPTLGSNLINDGLAADDPVRAAVNWGLALGADLEVWRHDDDGAPIIGRPQDLDRHPSASSTR